MAYQISGSFLDPLVNCFRILFSQCCKLGQDWKEKITDEEFLTELSTFLGVIQHRYTQLLSWPRNLLPGSNTARFLHQMTVGAIFASSFTLFLATAPRGQLMGAPGSDCWNTDAGSSIKSHSIPNNESVGLVLGGEASSTYIHTHHEVLFRELALGELFTLSMAIDSRALSYVC